MLLYESNFLKLTALTGDLGGSSSLLISRIRGDSDLHLEGIQREPYTTTLCMTYWLKGHDGREFKDPDMTIRIYHDAAQAEAVCCQDAHRHSLLREIRSSHLELTRRWQINMMLNKWLDYLIDCGHRFA